MRQDSDSREEFEELRKSFVDDQAHLPEPPTDTTNEDSSEGQAE